MKKGFKIIIIGIIVLVVIIIDSLQARLFKNSPIISIRDNDLIDKDSYVDRGIFIDTYYCVKEKDIVNVKWHFKFTKFICPIE